MEYPGHVRAEALRHPVHKPQLSRRSPPRGGSDRTHVEAGSLPVGGNGKE